jgi:hypothetical protein
LRHSASPASLASADVVESRDINPTYLQTKHSYLKQHKGELKMYSTNTNTPRPKRLITTSLIGAMAAAFCISAANATMTFTNRADFHAAAEADGIESMFGDSFEGDVATNDYNEQVFTSAAGVTYSGYVGVNDSNGWLYGGSPTDGAHYLAVYQNPYLTIDLPMPAQALGFDVIDFGDVTAGLLILTLENGESMTVAISGGPNANVQFFGLLSPVAFTNVVLYNEVASSDYYGIDHIEYGGVPAPGAIAMLGLAGLAGQRRRRRIA